MRKTKEPESPEPEEVGDTVEVKREAYLFLLRKAGTLPEELSAFPKGQGDRRFRFDAVNGPKWEGPKGTGPKGDDSNRGK